MPTSPPFVIDGIPCEVFVPDDGSQAITEYYGPGGPTATMLIKCDWGDRQRVIRRLLGTNTVMGRTVTQVPPLQYADAPGNLWVCTAVSNVMGIKFEVNQDTGFGFYRDAVLTCQFTVPTYDAVDPVAIVDYSRVPFSTCVMRTGTEVFVPANKATFFFSGNAARPLENSRVGLLDVHFEIEVTRHFMPYAFINAIGVVSGKLNTNVMTFGDEPFPPGYLLFLMGDITPTADPATGARVWDISLRFLGNQVHTWNQFLNETGAYETVQTTGAAPKFPYNSIDQARLFGNTF